MTRTRIVRWLRVLLPLLALAILSTMFLFSRQPDAESQIPYAEVDAEAVAREGRIVAPRYAGVTDDGAALSLHAASAAPAGGQGAGQGGGRAQDLRLDWRRLDNGLSADLTAPEGGVEEGLIRLDGGVRMSTSSGWRVEAEQIEAATDRSLISARDGIRAEAPFGQLEAGAMRLVPAGEGEDGAAGGGASVLNFTDGVRLIYQP